MRVTRTQLRRIIKEEKRKLLREYPGRQKERLAMRGLVSAEELTTDINNIIMELEEIVDIPDEPRSLQEEVTDLVGDAIVNLRRALSTLGVMSST